MKNSALTNCLPVWERVPAADALVVRPVADSRWAAPNRDDAMREWRPAIPDPAFRCALQGRGLGLVGSPSESVGASELCS